MTTMKRISVLAPMTAALALLASACTNPTVNPDSTFTVKGTALNAAGQPLANADVRLVRFFDELKLLQPTIDDLFRCGSTDCSYPDIGLEIGMVRSVKTDATGAFSIEVKGSEIAAKGGITDAQGKVEVSNLVTVVFDPSDAMKRAGVLSFDHLFQQTDKEWGVGSLRLWDSAATADVANSALSGLVKFTWKKLDRDTSPNIKNLYRVDVGGANSARFIARCREGEVLIEGGCDTNPQDQTELFTTISAYSLYAYYSDNGDFDAYVTATGVDFRYRSKFVVPAPIPNPMNNREGVGIDGIWAVSSAGNQALKNTKADDGNTTTRETINGQAKEIYVHFSTAEYVTDAGLLNSVVKDAHTACVVVEFSTNGQTTIDGAKGLPTSEWTATGKFCGSVGAPNEMAALMSFDTTSSDGRLGAWMRYRVIADANENPSATPFFQQVGEVAIYRKRQ